MKTKILLTFFLLLGLISFAQPGEIDNSFNLSGIGAYGGTAFLPTVDGAKDGIVYKTDVYLPSSIHKDKIIIIGRFSSYNGVQRKKIARINPDGSLDTAFNTPYFNTEPINEYLYCVKILPDNKIIIGGVFVIGNYTNIARLNADGTIDNTFNPAPSGGRGTNGPVHAIALQSDGKILFGGSFTTFNGTGNRRLLRLNSDGTLDSTFNTTGTPNGEVRAIAIQKLNTNANKILIGGFFDGWTGQTNKGHLIRVLPNGDFDTAFNVGGTGITGGSAVFDIIVKPDSDSFFAVGKFTTFNGVARNSVVFLTNNAQQLMSTIGTGLNETIFSAKFQPDGKVLLGGNFKVFDGVTIPKGITRISIVIPASPAVPYIVRDATFLTGTGFNGGTGVYEGVSVIRDLVLQSDGKIIVSGDYTQYDGTPRRMIARIKTRECRYASVFSNGIWKDGIAIDATTIDNYMAVTDGEFIIPTGSHFKACELEIQSGGTLTIQPGASLTVNGIVMNNGTFAIQNTGSLVQIKEDTKNADLGAGTFSMSRDVNNLKGFDFVYWSSPVENQSLYDLSPTTRFDKYYKWNTSINNWQVITNGAEIMAEGKGYIARAPSAYLTTNSYTYNATFFGRANNGKILTPVIVAGSSNMNLIGNPYPSAIDAKLFLNDNDNLTKLGTAIYLWSHKTGITSYNGGATYGYANSDYIAYTKLGAVLTDPTATLFNGKVAAGQGFFVAATAGGNATFTNAMRVKESNDQFYKTSEDLAQNTNNRLWFDLSNEGGAFKQILVGFTSDSSLELDRNDGESMNGNSYIDFYSMAASKKLVIQGRPLPLDINQAVPLGFTAYAAGTYKIALHQFDGLFANQNVYLVDKLTHVTHDIKIDGYTFTTAAGNFENRFEIRFANETLATNNNIDSATDSAIVIAKDSSISVKSTESIDSITVYDVNGKLLYNKKGIDAVNFTTDNLNVQHQMVLVLIKMTNDSVLTKKMML